MDIIISNASDKPIYDQIVSQMKALILTGERAKGSSCPPSEHWPATCHQRHHDQGAYAELELKASSRRCPASSFVAGGNLELLREERFGIEGCSSRPSTKRAARTSASRTP
ncbi:MAG: hypothetical protein ACLSGS_10700 [Adlercreutzia sp.]